MREREGRIASHGVRKVVAGFVHHGRVTGRRDSVTTHEFRVRHWVSAVTGTLPDDSRTLRPIQRGGDLSGKVSLEAGKSINFEITLLCEARAFQMGVEHFER